MFVTRWVASLLLTAAILVACSPHTQAAAIVQKRHGLRRELLGCYALTDDHGKPVTAMTFHPPSVAMLDSVAAGDDAWRLRPDGAPPSGVPHMTAWSADSLTDTIRLSFTNGLYGTDFVLSAQGDRLQGRAVGFGDAGPAEWDEGPVTGQRVNCPAPSTGDPTTGSPAT